MLRSTRAQLPPATPAVLLVGVLAMLAVVGAGVAWPTDASAEPRRAVVVTDSILLGAQAPLVGRLQGAGWTVDFDGSVSRSTAAGAEAVRSHGLALYDTLVVGLGANDSGNTATFRSRVDAVMAAAGAVPHVYWLTIREVRPYYAPANQVLRDAAARYPNLQVIDWNAAAAAASGLTSSDGLHLTPAGAQRLADLVAGTVAFGAAPAPAAAPVDAATPVPAPDASPPPEQTGAPEPSAPVAEAAGPLAPVVSTPRVDRQALVAGVADEVVPARRQPIRADGGAIAAGGPSAWWWLVAGVVVAVGAYLVTSRVLLAPSPLGASLRRTSGPVRRAPLSRPELRAARIAGAQRRHPSTTDVPPVPDEPVSAGEPEVAVRDPGVLSGSPADTRQKLSR